MYKTAIKAGILAATISGLVYIAGPRTPENTFITFNSEVTGASMTAALDTLGAAEKIGGQVTLVLYTPGGEVAPFMGFIDRFNRTPLHTTTRINTFAASCGAIMFAMGDEREMVFGSKVLFHRIRLDTTFGAIFEEDLADFLNGKMPVILFGPAGQMAPNPLYLKLASIPREHIVEIYESIKDQNERFMDILAARFGREVANKLLVGKTDVLLSAKQAKDLGVATKVVVLQTTRLGAQSKDVPLVIKKARR